MESTCLENPQATIGHISRDTNCNSKQNIMKVNEHPEWLPAGWSVDVRTRKSGAHMGSEYKCYIEPSNGHRFYSKPEVLRYLETLKQNSCTSKKEKKCANLHSPSKDVVQTTTVEDLPPGWIKDIRVRKGNGSRKDLYYIDPVSGYVFRSKKDALRYLESGDISTCVLKPYKREMLDEDMSTASPAAKRQKLKQSATRRQLFVGKEMFDKSSLELPDANSSKGVADMKVSAEIMVVPVPTDETVVKMHSEGDIAADPPDLNEKSNPADVQEKDCIVNEEENGNTKNHSNPSRSRNKKELSVPNRFSKRLAGIEPSQVTGTVDHERALQAPNRYLKSRRSANADLAKKSSQQFNFVSEIKHVQNASCMNMPMQGESLNKSDKPSEDQGVSREQHQLETEKIDDNKPEQLQYSLSRDSSSPGINVVKKTSITGESPVLDNPHTGQSLASEVSAIKENKLHVSTIEKTGDRKIHVHSNKSSNKKDQRMPYRASKRLAGFEPELMNNSIYGEKPPEYKSRKSKNEVNTVARQSEDGVATELADHDPVNVRVLINGKSSKRSRKSPNVPDIADKQVELIGNEEIYDENSASQLSFAFHYSWSDPCLEFAIKTLTGVLPIEDTVGNDSNLVPETGVIEKNKLSESGIGSTSDRNPQVNLKKHENKKELRLPRRLSKRLAGHEPELVPAERPLEYAARKSYKDIPAANVLLNNGVSEHLDASNEAEYIVPASSSSKATGAYGESSNMGNEVQTIPEEQLQKLEAEKIVDQNSNVNLNNEASKHLSTSKETEHSVHASYTSETREHGERLKESEKSHKAQTVLEEQLQPLNKTEHLDASNEAEHIVHASDSSKATGAHGESSDMSNEVQTIPEEQLQKLEAEKIVDQNSNVNLNNEASKHLGTSKETEHSIHASYTSETREHGERLNESEKSHKAPTVLEEQLQPLNKTEHLDASNEAEHIVHASDSSKATGAHGESSNMCNEVQTIPEEQLQKLEAEKIVDQNSNVNLNNEASKHLGTSKETEHNVHAAYTFETREHGERLNESESEKSHKAQTVLEEQLQPLNKTEKSYEAPSVPEEQQLHKPEAENIGDQSSEPQLSLLFGDSWSDDPCLEFAFKTLTGALPVEDTADVLHVMSPSVITPPNQVLLESMMEKGINEEVHDNSNQSKNKTEFNLVWQPSERNLGQPDLRTNAASCERSCSNFLTKQSYCDQAYSTTRNLDEGNSLNTEGGNVTQLNHHSRNIDMFRQEEQPAKKVGQVIEGDAVPAEQSQLETLTNENPESQLCAPFMDSWSDPCLQFAFKTLSGAIPVEENLAMQECFQGPANCHGQGQRDGGSKLPYFVSPRFPQSDISSHHDKGEKSMPGEQPSVSSSFIPLENVSIHDCSGRKPHPNYSKF